MNDRTQAALDVLEKVEWFANVGVKDTEVAIVLSSWQEAMKYCNSVDGENFGIAPMNQHGQLLRSNAGADFRWNPIVDALEPSVRPLVGRKTERLVREHNLPREPFELMVYRAVLLACVEVQCADIQPPGFFAGLIYWYMKGHFPCGWTDVRTKGKYIDFYPPGFYDPIAKWYESGDFGDWQGQLPKGKFIVY